nr:FixH family protein [Myxococcota bacterium]
MNATLRWTLIIIGFLVANALAMAFLVVASSSSRAQVIPDYYERAAHYDDVIDQASRNRALGWRTSIDVVGGALLVEVRDSSGTPLDDARVQVTGAPRAHAASTFAVELATRGSGRYQAAHAGRAGVHDVTVTVERAGHRFTSAGMVEI